MSPNYGLDKLIKNVFTLPKVSCRFNTIPNIPKLQCFFIEIEIYMESKIPQILKTFMPPV